MSRARVIIIRDGMVALMRRVRKDRLYYLFPGGGVEAGETLCEACVREAREELGVQIRPERCIAEVTYQGDTHYFFLSEMTGGRFGSGMGEEYEKDIGIYGTYEPVWMDIGRLEAEPVFPLCVSEIVRRSQSEGFPEKPRYFLEDDNNVCVETNEPYSS